MNTCPHCGNILGNNNQNIQYDVLINCYYCGESFIRERVIRIEDTNIINLKPDSSVLKMER